MIKPESIDQYREWTKETIDSIYQSDPMWKEMENSCDVTSFELPIHGDNFSNSGSQE